MLSKAKVVIPCAAIVLRMCNGMERRTTMKALENYLNIGSCKGPQWKDAEHIIYVHSGVGGKHIICKNIRSDEETTLYTTQEQIWKTYASNDGRIFFTSDLGGNENEQVFMVNDTAAINLTNEPSVRHYFGGLKPDGRTLVYSSNKRCKQSFDIIAHDIENGEQRIILENSDNYNTPAALSPDGKYLLYNKLLGGSDNAMWMVNTETGEAVRRPDVIGKSAEKFPAWTPDSKGIYYVTDRDSDFFRVAYCNAKDGIEQEVVSFNWDVENLVLAPDGKHLAMLINENGYSILKIYDMESKTFCNIPQAPAGVYALYDSISWAPSGLKLAFTVSSGTRAQDVWVLDMEADAIKRISSCIDNGMDNNDFVEPDIHSFKSFDGLEVPYFIYVPKGKQLHDLPVMISIHGGPEGQSRPNLSGKEFLQYIVSQGIAVVEPNVRGSIGYGKTYSHLDDVEKRLDSVKDIEFLVKHLIDTGIANAKRISVMGTSYGGFMTLSCAARYPELWCCAVCTVGMFNLVTFLENTAPYRRPHRESEYGTLAHDRETLFNVSPVAAVDGIRGPLMIIHGRNDPRVPVSEAIQTMDYIKGRGVDAQMLIYEDEGHGVNKLKNKLDCYPKMLEFVKKYMQLG